MLVHLQGAMWPGKTFLLIAEPWWTVAHFRSAFVHILDEMGRNTCDFRFRFKGIFMKSSHTLAEYNLRDRDQPNIEIVPIGKASLNKDGLDIENDQFSQATVAALAKERAWFMKRERLFANLSGLMWAYLICSLVLFATKFWYSALWSLLLWAYGYRFLPTFVRTGGYIADTPDRARKHVIFFTSFIWANVVVLTILCALQALQIKKGCTVKCTAQDNLSAVMYAGTAFLLFFIAVISTRLTSNLRHGVGELMDSTFMATRSIPRLLSIMEKGSLKEKRFAALEISSLASFNDDIKMQIVGHNGISILLQTVLNCEDDACKEFALEAITDLLTFKPCQDAFVADGGIRSLLAILTFAQPLLVCEALAALSTLVVSEPKYKVQFLAHGGLVELSSCAKRTDLENEGANHVADIILELLNYPQTAQEVVEHRGLIDIMINLLKCSLLDAQIAILSCLCKIAEIAPHMLFANKLISSAILKRNLVRHPRLHILIASLIRTYTSSETVLALLVAEPQLFPAINELSTSSDIAVLQIVTTICETLNASQFKDASYQKGLKDVMTRLGLGL